MNIAAADENEWNIVSELTKTRIAKPIEKYTRIREAKKYFHRWKRFWLHYSRFYYTRYYDGTRSVHHFPIAAFRCSTRNKLPLSERRESARVERKLTFYNIHYVRVQYVLYVQA